MRTTRLFAIAFLLSVAPVLGQSLTLQSPVFAQFSVRTNVSVPDRGGVYLGGVKRATEGTASRGFNPFGSSRGRSVSHSGASSHVYIHDFAAMDPFLRNRDEVRRQIAAQRIDPVKEKRERQTRAAKAYEKLAVKAEKKGKAKLAKWYRDKAREYNGKTQIAERPKTP